MAKGDYISFDQFRLDLGLKKHNLNADSIKIGLVDNTLTPARTDADPRWGAGGGTNFSTNEVTPGGNYPAGGPALTGQSYTLVSGVPTFDADDVSIAQDAANPSGVVWGIMYNATSAGKECIGFIQLVDNPATESIDLSAVPLNIIVQTVLAELKRAADIP